MRTRLTSTLVLALLVGLSVSICAEEAPASKQSPLLTPGEGPLSTSDLTPFTATYNMSRAGEDWAKAVIDLSAVQVEGRAAFRHRYSMYFSTQTVYDETLFDAKSGAPLMKFIHGGLPPSIAYKLYTFRKDKLSGSTVFADGSDPATLAQKFEKAVFGGGTDYLMIASLPLANGYSGQLLTADDSGARPNLFTVEGKETLEIAGVSYPTWIVSVQGGMAKRWISAKAPYLIKLEVPVAGIAWQLAKVERIGAFVKQ